jgi:hypothetical protein
MNQGFGIEARGGHLKPSTAAARYLVLIDAAAHRRAFTAARKAAGELTPEPRNLMTRHLEPVPAPKPRVGPP